LLICAAPINIDGIIVQLVSSDSCILTHSVN